MSISDNCTLCPDEHTYTCDCKHPHAEHIFAGGCTNITNGKRCQCEGYSQKKKILLKK